VGTIIEPPSTTLSRNQHSLKGGRRRMDTDQVAITTNQLGKTKAASRRLAAFVETQGSLNSSLDNCTL